MKLWKWKHPYNDAHFFVLAEDKDDARLAVHTTLHDHAHDPWQSEHAQMAWLNGEKIQECPVNDHGVAMFSADASKEAITEFIGTMTLAQVEVIKN